METQITDPSPVTPVAPVVTSSHPKWPWILIALALLVVVGSAGIFLGKQMSSPTPTPIVAVPTVTSDPTANWQIYTSSKYNYTFKYPQNWTIQTVLPSDMSTDLEYTIVSPPGADPNEGVMVVTNLMTDGPLSLNWFKNTELKHEPSGTTLEQLGISETSYLGENALVDKSGAMYIEKNKYLYYIGWLHGGASDTKNVKVTFNQILSTFKFGSSSTSITTPSTATLAKTVISYRPQSGWATYSDSVAKFSIQYNTISTPPFNSHFSLGENVAGDHAYFLTCLTPASGPSAGKEVCLSGYDVKVFNNYSGGSRREWLNANYPNIANCDNQYEDVALAGKNALGVIADDCSSYVESFILVPNGSQMLFIHAITDYHRDAWFKEALATLKYL